MKNIKKHLLILIIFVATFTFSNPAKAEKNTGAFLVDPLSLFLGYIATELELVVTDTVTVGPELGVLLPLYTIDDFKYFMVTGGARANFYLGGGSYSSSFYVAPRLGVAYARVSDDDDSASATRVYAGALVGYRWLLEHTTIKLGAGIKSAFGDTRVEINGKKEDMKVNTTFAPNFEFSFGFRF